MHLYSFRRWHPWLTGSALALCLMLCAACGDADLPAATPASARVNTTPTYPVYNPGDRQTRESAVATQDTLARTPPPGPTLTAFAQQLYSELSTPLPAHTPHTLPYIVAGVGRIYQDSAAYMGFPPINNRWIAELGEELIEVYAGRDRFDATQGVLIVLQKNRRTGVGRGPEEYNTPIKAGAVEVIDAVDQRLTLRADDGTLFYFDVLTRQWVNPTPGASPEAPVHDPQAYHATVVALVATLPTASPIPGLPPDKTQDRQTNDLWDRAERTAVAMNPPPNPYPTEQVATPDALTTHEGETPHQVAGAGIIWQEKWSPHFSKLIHTLNQWVERKNQQGNSVLVCAGSKSPREDPQQGIIGILVQVPNSDTIVSGPDLYLTPLRAGAVQVIDAVGERLTLRADDGTIFYFDVPTRQWVDPASVPEPSIVPMLPTSTLTRPDMDAMKVARYEQQRQEWGAMATRIANGTPFAYTPIPIRTAAPRPSPVLGIYNGCADPDLYYTYRSCWAGLQDSEYLFVSSGALKSEPSQGMVRVYTTTLDQRTRGPEQTYTTPLKAGLVLIISSINQRLTLQAENGTLFYFDVLTRQWVTPDATPAPPPVPSLPPTP